MRKKRHNTNLELFEYQKRLISNTFWLLAGDSFSLILSLFLAGLLRYLLKEHMMAPSRSFLLVPVWCVGAILFRLVPGWGLGVVEELRRIQILLVALFGVAAVMMFLSKSADVTSRIKYGLMYLINVPLLPLVRVVIRKHLISCGMWGVPAVIYGTDETVNHVLDVIMCERSLGYQPIGVFDDDPGAGSIKGVPILGKMEDYTERAPFAVLGTPSIQRERLRHLLEGPLAGYRRVIIIPDLLDIPSLWVRPCDFMGVLGLELTRNLLNPFARIIKQVAEWCVVVFAMPLWVPVLVVITLAIWLADRANPFYRQERVGRYGRVFKTWKFRSMVPDAEHVLQERLEEDSVFKEQWENDCKLKDDPRITAVGRLLRRTSLDELPQLFNVLVFEMSLVGPRPLPQYHHQQLARPVRDLREQVLPGITGLWQVSGRSESGTAGMERWDTYYVRNWSPWLDVVILVRTIKAVFSAEGAY